MFSMFLSSIPTEANPNPHPLCLLRYRPPHPTSFTLPLPSPDSTSMNLVREKWIQILTTPSENVRRGDQVEEEELRSKENQEVEIKANGTLMKMVAADWLKSDKREDDLTGRSGGIVQKYAAQGGNEFFFIVNIQFREILEGGLYVDGKVLEKKTDDMLTKLGKKQISSIDAIADNQLFKERVI